MGELKIQGWIVEVKDHKAAADTETFFQTWEEVSSAVAAEYIGCANKTIIITPLTLVPEV